ncbi:hypothetical protein B0H14DRAFT_2567769 [Mycena olivaceomarginata]|nr:hypothetical protein B0H14DRAFT_2567769 [Mycena olivaceomarginata]
MRIELAFDIAEGATKSYEILEPEAERYPESLRMKAPPIPVFNAHMSVGGKADASPPVDPVDLVDPLITSTEADFSSAWQLRYAEIRWVAKDARERENEKLGRGAEGGHLAEVLAREAGLASGFDPEIHELWFNDPSSTDNFKQTGLLRIVLGILCQFAAFN